LSRSKLLNGAVKPLRVRFRDKVPEEPLFQLRVLKRKFARVTEE
jgi:hypothetical protein